MGEAGLRQRLALRRTGGIVAGGGAACLSASRVVLGAAVAPPAPVAAPGATAQPYVHVTRRYIRRTFGAKHAARHGTRGTAMAAFLPRDTYGFRTEAG